MRIVSPIGAKMRGDLPDLISAAKNEPSLDVSVRRSTIKFPRDYRVTYGKASEHCDTGSWRTNIPSDEFPFTVRYSSGGVLKNGTILLADGIIGHSN